MLASVQINQWFQLIPTDHPICQWIRFSVTDATNWVDLSLYLSVAARGRGHFCFPVSSELLAPGDGNPYQDNYGGPMCQYRGKASEISEWSVTENRFHDSDLSDPDWRLWNNIPWLCRCVPCELLWALHIFLNLFTHTWVLMLHNVLFKSCSASAKGCTLFPFSWYQ